jgi:uncharacterized damage-inducible protein DinB
MEILKYKEYIDYTNWANHKVIDWLQQLTEAQLLQPVVSSFGSLLETVHHIISAEHVWIQRLIGATPIWLQPTLPQNINETIVQWKATMQLWQDYSATLTEDKITNICSFTRINGSQLSMQVANIILHCQNHSTQHRGQLITLLRQVEFTKVSSLDFFTYCTNIN